MLTRCQQSRCALALAASMALAGCGGDEAATPATTPQAEAPYVPWITDAEGRAMIFHGINVDNRAKVGPEHLPALTQADAARIAKGWGFDFVRLLVLWDAIEPQPGQIDEAYLDRVATRVDWLAAEGISVMLDMHQDVYAAQFCCDGAPAWAVFDDGKSFELQSTWSVNYLQPAVQAAFDNFWAADGAHPELQRHYAAAWKAVAARFRGHPGVVGYDVMNEPFPGSDFDLTEALLRVTPADGGSSRRFDEQKFAPFYQRVIGSIREADPDTWIFFEPRYAAPGNGSPSFVPRLDDPRAGTPRIAYGPHLYSTLLEANGAYGKTDVAIAAWEAERAKETARWPVPVVIGEWGLAFGAGDATRFAEETLAMADRTHAGWAYWSWDPSDAKGWGLFDGATGADNPSADVVVRPYPRRVAGEPVRWSYDPATRLFELVVRPRDGVTGATEIYVPAKRHYPNGWQLSVTPEPAGGVVSSWDAEREIVSLTLDASASERTVRVAPK